MACNERIAEMLPDYYLGQLPEEQAEEVRLHLSESPECRQALEEVAEVLDLLPFAAPSEELPANLKERTLARALQEDSASAARTPVPLYPSRAVGSSRREHRRGGIRRYLAPLVAAVSLLALAVAGGVSLNLYQENQRLEAEVRQLEEEPGAPEPGVQEELVAVAAEGTGEAPGARGTAVVDHSDGGLALAVYNLPPPPEGHSYQAWLVEFSGAPTPLGEMETDTEGGGHMTGEAGEPLETYESVEITVEPADGEDKSGPV